MGCSSVGRIVIGESQGPAVHASGPAAGEMQCSTDNAMSQGWRWVQQESRLKGSRRPTGQQCVRLAHVEESLRDALRDIFKGRALRGWRTIVTLEFAAALKVKNRPTLGSSAKTELSHVEINWQERSFPIHEMMLIATTLDVYNG